ncbi:AMP-binding protein [bacterium RCC_150]
MNEPASTGNLRAARDQLIALRNDHERAVAEFSWPDVGRVFNWARDWFDCIAEDNDQDAVVILEEDGTRTARTFGQLRESSDRVAASLTAHGIGAGDAVMLMVGNQLELWESMLAIMKIGAIIMPTTTALGREDLADRIERASVRCIIANTKDTGKFEGIASEQVKLCIGPTAAGWIEYHATHAESGPALTQEVGSKDPLLLYFTSGTTSKPKLVEHTNISYPVGHLSTMYWLGLQPGDVHLNISSPGWAKHAWSCFFAPWLAEATVFSYNYSRFDARAFLEVLTRESVTSICAPPTVWRMLLNVELGARPPHLRELIAAGEPLNPEVIARVQEKWGLTIRDGFGQTETTASVGNTPGSLLKPGSMGRPLPGVPVVLVDPLTGTALPPGTAGAGEVSLDLSRSPLTLMTGYIDDPVRDAESRAGGFYRTGDIASIDSDGYITYVGRADDVFKSSDYKISPFELESALIEHPAITEAAVVPAPDPIRQTVVKAYLVLSPGYSPTRETALDIFRFTRSRLAPFQRIRRIEFLDLPKTISGKIRRVELRQRELSLADSRIATEWREDQMEELVSSP